MLPTGVTAQNLRNAYWGEQKTLVALGTLYDRSPGAVRYWFQQLGIPTRGIKESQALTARAVSPDEVAEMTRLYTQGLSCFDVGKRLGRAAGLVGDHLRRVGVTRDQKTSIRLAVSRGKIRTTTLNERFFETLTPASAWVLGLIFGEGHVRIKLGESYSVYLAGTEQVLQKVAKHLRFNRSPKRVRVTNCWVLVWNSRKMVSDLTRYGLLGGNKSKTMRWATTLPTEMLFHFVRGLWDSDGSWRLRGSCLNASYTSASSGFVRDLKQVLENQGWTPKTRTRKVSAGVRIGNKQHTPVGKQLVRSDLRLSARDSREFAKWVYADTTAAIRCDRKYNAAICGRGYGC